MLLIDYTMIVEAKQLGTTSKAKVNSQAVKAGYKSKATDTLTI